MLKKQYKKISNKVLFFIIFGMLSFGRQANAAGLVPCEGITDDPLTNCDFNKLIEMLNNIMNFVIFKLPIILLVLVFAWSGIMLIINRDRAGMLKLIKKNLLNVVIGYLVIIGAYLIVKIFITLIAGQELTFKVFFN